MTKTNKPGRWLSLPGQRDFRLLLCGQWISHLGDGIYTTALPLFVLLQTGLPAQTGLIAGLALIPFIAFSPLAGVHVDRTSRKSLIIAMDVGRSAVLSAMGLPAWTGHLSMPLLAVGTLVAAVGTAFFEPAIMASVPNLVRPEEVTGANSLFSMGRTLGEVVGPALGMVVITLAGYPVASMLNAVSYLVAGAFTAFIAIPHFESAPSPDPGWFARSRPGLYQYSGYGYDPGVFCCGRFGSGSAVCNRGPAPTGCWLPGFGPLTLLLGIGPPHRAGGRSAPENLDVLNLIRQETRVSF